MSRIEKKLTITSADRDNGKVFVITEMAPRVGHKWATRALFALMNSGFEVPDELLESGFAGLATLGIKALGKAQIEVMEPLLDELFECVRFVPDPSKPNVMLSDVDRHVEEIKTLFLLQKEVLTLHVGPFMTGVVSNGASTPTAAPIAT